MLTTLARVCLVIALFATAMGAGKARAQDFLNQEWCSTRAFPTSTCRP